MLVCDMMMITRQNVQEHTLFKQWAGRCACRVAMLPQGTVAHASCAGGAGRHSCWRRTRCRRCAGPHAMRSAAMLLAPHAQALCCTAARENPPGHCVVIAPEGVQTPARRAQSIVGMSSIAPALASMLVWPASTPGRREQGKNRQTLARGRSAFLLLEHDRTLLEHSPCQACPSCC